MTKPIEGRARGYSFSAKRWVYADSETAEVAPIAPITKDRLPIGIIDIDDFGVAFQSPYLFKASMSPINSVVELVDSYNKLSDYATYHLLSSWFYGAPNYASAARMVFDLYALSKRLRWLPCAPFEFNRHEGTYQFSYSSLADTLRRSRAQSQGLYVSTSMAAYAMYYHCGVDDDYIVEQEAILTVKEAV